MSTHTEEEAAKLWCPMMGSKKRTPWLTGATCVGSNCMMWRWHGAATRDPRSGHMVMTKAPQETGHSTKRILTDLPGRGYCGLAGTPASL